MAKKIILIFLIFFSLISIVDAWSRYKYVCNNNICNSTKRNFISNNYYLYNVVNFEVSNFSEFIDWKLNDYLDYYWDTKFTISWYCEGDCDSLENKELDLASLLNLNSEFHIWQKIFYWLMWIRVQETYDSWIDYLFSNFSSVINDLHTGFPEWDKKSNLDDILINILSYDPDINNFNIKNVCTSNNCTESKLKKISYADLNPFKFISWDIKQSSYFKNDTFKVSNDYNISRLILKAWESINFNFWFEDYLEFDNDETEYEYRIYYNYEWEDIPNYEKPFLKENITVNNNSFEFNAPTVAEGIIDLEVIDEDDKKIRVWVEEWIVLTKAWKINFYLAAKNISSWDDFPLTQINSIPITVLPNDKFGSSFSEITSTFSSELNSYGSWFNPNAPFTVKINLFDEHWNGHFDNIDWYDISISNWSSQSIKIAKNGDENYWTEITWLKSSIDNSISFKFIITEPEYHILNWFDIKARSKFDSNNYKIPDTYYGIKEVFPSNLYDANKQKMTIFIKSPIISELPVSCWNTVTVNFICTSDNFSWCNASGNTSKFYNSQDQNWSTGSVTVVDYAHNVAIYNYTMNHVDHTAPTITLYKWTIWLDNDEYNYIANSDNLKLEFDEWTTDSCIAKVNYLVKVNWIKINEWSKFWKKSEIIIPKFFEKSWDKELSVEFSDNYWNTSSKIVNFHIVPDYVDESKSSVNLVSWIKNSLYANNHDKYEYELELLDKYSNPIYDKSIQSLNTECGDTWCETIKTKINNNWNDALIESYNNFTKTDDNWIISFNLKSLAPWTFNEKFKIEMYEWDSEYKNTFKKKAYNIWYFSNSNSFKSPIKLELSIEWWAKPQIWRDQRYELKLTKDNNNNLVLDSNTNWFVNISKNTIFDNIPWHKWGVFSVINKNFSSNNLNKFLWFTWSIDVNENILEWANVVTKDLDISYYLWGQSIQYYLPELDIKWCDVSTLWLEVIWTLQWDWKSNITGQDENFSDLSKSELRSQIRMNWFKLIKWLTSWKIVNWIKYVEWDVPISGNNLWYETLIVKNWNVIINWDLNTNNKKLWIIVLKDNYLTNSDYNNKWNVYVTNNVKKINAIIYADGAFRSANSNWTSYPDNQLTNKLEINWTLFTRNTIWWAVSWGWKYLLPWWQETTNFDLAEIYDLNYVRKINNACSEASFRIKYDSSIQTNPPIGFSSN